MTTAISTATSTARACPFVGPRSFRFREHLFGRDREILKLLDLLIAERIVLLFSPSGAGKTSLIQAGLIRALREEGFHDLPIIRVKQPTVSDREDAVRGVTNRFIRSTLASLESRRPEAPEDPPDHLVALDSPEHALRRWADTLRHKTDRRAPRMVLIFDQFEELLTTDPADIAAKQAFFDQLGAVLKDPGLWALFAMREEYVAALEPYLNRVPRRLSSRFRLDLLDADAARQAFERPFESQGITVTPAAVNKLVADLGAVRIQRPDGTTEVVAGPYVEPVHLQIVGLRHWNRFAVESGFDQLDETHVGGTEGSVNTALGDYYADKVHEIGATTDVGERSVREWCECQLLTDQGLRGQVLREPGKTRGLPETVIQKLIDAFLVRAEDRRGLTWYELAHDRLIEPMRDDNREWRQQHLHPSLLRATDWENAGRPDSLLLHDPELKDAESWAGFNPTFLVEGEREFIRISRAEGSKRRIRKYVVAGSMTVLVLVAVSSVKGWLTAVSERRNAEEQRQFAEQLSREARRRNSELIIDRGISLCQQGRMADGLLWLMRGLEHAGEIEPPDRDLDHLARLELAAWRAEMASLRWFQRLGGAVLAVDLSPDGRTAITGGEDKTARLWDAASGQPQGPALKHDGSVTAVAFSPADGRTALTGSKDGTARLWDVATGQPKGPPLRHDSPVFAVALSPDGRTALTGNEDGTARLWDLASAQPKGPPLKHYGPVNAVAFSPEGHTAVTGSDDTTAQLWDLASLQPKGPPLVHSGPVTAVALSIDGRAALTGSQDRTVRLWDLASAHSKGPNLKHKDLVTAVALSPDGRTAMTGSKDGTSRLWDLASAQPKGPPMVHDGWVYAVAFSPDGRTTLTGSADKTARLWDVVSGQPKGSPMKHDGMVYAVAFSPDGRTALTGSADKSSRLWDVATGHPKGPPMVHDGRVYAVAFSSNGHTALTGSLDKTARLWDLATGQPTGAPLVHDGGVYAVAFSPDGRTALTGSADTTARLWHVETQKPMGFPMNNKGPVTGTAYSPDGTMVLTSSLDGTAQLWLTQSQKQIGAPLSHGGPVNAVAYSLDGGWIATASGDKTAQLWRTPAPVEGSVKRLSLWVRVVTSMELDESHAVRSLEPDTWQKDRDELDRLGGPLDRPGVSETAVSKPR
jgi:WD40 repeat protein